MDVREGQGSYMEGALRLLQYVEGRRPTGRRFGPDADARWTSFRGDLETVDRLELMIRDADAEWPGSFGARTVYGLRAVAEDEPFGGQWQSLDPVDAEELWRRVKALAAPTSPGEALRAIASGWNVPIAAHDVGLIGPTDRLLVTGPSAIVATIEAFAAGSDLDWTDQVTVVATPAAHRQLAGAATALLNATRSFRLLAKDEATPDVKLARATRLVESADADPADRAAAQALLGA